MKTGNHDVNVDLESFCGCSQSRDSLELGKITFSEREGLLILCSKVVEVLTRNHMAEIMSASWGMAKLPDSHIFFC